MVLATPTKTMDLALLCQPFAWIPAIHYHARSFTSIFLPATFCGKVIVLASFVH